jgi:5-methylcytosine-specific restriction endonuclease McrA
MSGKWKRYRPEHSRMFNDPRWADLKRLVWLRDGGRCQMCKREGIEAGIQDGYIRSGFACHHIVPFESAKTTAEMERLFFDANNIMLVCRECHAKIHRELGSHKKEVVQARRKERFERWKEKIQGPGKPDDDKSADPRG